MLQWNELGGKGMVWNKGDDMNFNTVSKRRNYSSDVLSMIDEYNDGITNLEKRSSVTLSNLCSDDMEDKKYREIATDSAYQIIGSYNEAHILDKYEFNTDAKSYQWMRIYSIYLPSYAYGADSVMDSSGTVYSSTIKDFNIIWRMLKPYSASRNRWLNGNYYSDIFDDMYVTKRNYFKSKNTYGDVVSDASYGTFSGLSKSYKTVVTDTETVEVETSETPLLPSADDFADLVLLNGTDETMADWLSLSSGVLRSLSSSSSTSFSDFSLKLSDIKSSYATISTNSEYELSAAKSYMASIPDGLYFVNGDTYAYSIVNSKEYYESSRTIKSEYATYYNEADADVKKNVYNEYPDIYFNIKYKVRLVLRILESSGESSTSMTPVASATDSQLSSICSSIKKNILSYLNDAYDIYTNNPDGTRAEDYEPSINYPAFIKGIKNSGVSTKQGCVLMLNYISGIDSWKRKRCTALYNSTDDSKNISKMINALSKRLNKMTGSFMLWYQSVLGIDDSVKDLNTEKAIVLNSIQYMIVAKAYNGSDSKLFNFQDCPNYIDISPVDSLYSSGFKEGDSVYLTDDSHAEFGPITIKSLQINRIKTTSYSSANLSDYANTGTISGAVVSYDKVTRLVLSSNIPTYFCNSNDVSTLRVIKIV